MVNGQWSMVNWLTSSENLAISWSFDILIEDDLTYAISYNLARSRVLHALDKALDVSLKGGVLEGTIALCIEGTVFENKVMCVAKWLFASDMAIDQSQVL